MKEEKKKEKRSLANLKYINETKWAHALNSLHENKNWRPAAREEQMKRIQLAI